MKDWQRVSGGRFDIIIIREMWHVISTTPAPQSPESSRVSLATTAEHSCAVCAIWGWERAGPQGLGPGFTGSLTYCASVTTALHLMTQSAGLELVMAWSTFYLTQRTPHCPPPISTHTYKVCSYRKQLLISKTFKDLNKLLQNIGKNPCRGNLSVSSKPVWFLLLKIYWNS